ncbi:hypothetical protein HAX54_050733 [Datura stramonium]|uniref:Uncharacterized protein n=1 Tax=Datura stramonium TaxID=4076 RepID=A0ABS8SXM9_DATST|nr:hypothetical protein [Datura stramonium]
MAKNYQMNTKESQYKKIFKLDNRKKQNPSSAIGAAEIKGKSKSTMASAGSDMVLIEYNHSNKSTDNSNNDKYFSGYIDRVKNKMRTTTLSVSDDDDGGGGIIRKAPTRRDSLNDKISRYINRAELKIRTTTIVSRGDHI